MTGYAFIRITGSCRLYVGGQRVHHGLVGAALLVVGAVLVWDDRRDFPWPLVDREGH